MTINTTERRRPMDILDRLERAMRSEESYFRAQLLREDVARLKKLRELAGRATSEETFVRDGLCVDWTPAGLRNGELTGTLEPLLKAFFAASRAAPEADTNAHLFSAWCAFDAQRIDLLVGCLSRVPRPDRN
jgi:hypothetical protein